MESNKNEDGCYCNCPMYGVNKLNMDTHEYVVNLKVNVNYLHVKVKSEICCDIDHRK